MLQISRFHTRTFKVGSNFCKSIQKCTRRTATAILVHCSLKTDDKKKTIEFPDSSNLTHEQLIKHACTETVNSTCQLLTCTLVALVDVAEKYKKSLLNQLSLMEESLVNFDNEVLQEELTDLTTAVRSEVDTFRKNFTELNSFMEYVEKLVNSATETSFLAGAEIACNALSERLHSAKTVIDEHKQSLKTLEQELVRLQEAIINKSKPK